MIKLYEKNVGILLMRTVLGVRKNTVGMCDNSLLGKSLIITSLRSVFRLGH